MKTFSAIFIIAAIAIAVSYVSSIDAQSPYSHRTSPVSAELLFGALGVTGATGPSGAVTLTTLAVDCTIAAFENTTNVEVDVLIGSTKKRVPTLTSRAYDLGAASTRWASGTVIKAYAPTAPGSGAFEFFCQPY
jgi:hypothetical protein